MPQTPAITGIVSYLATTFGAITAGATYNVTLTNKVFLYRTKNEAFQAAEIPGVNLRVAGEPQPTDLMTSKWDHLSEVLIDIIATTADEFHNTLIDLLVAIETDYTLGGRAIDTDFLGYSLEYDQEDQAFKGGTARLRIHHRTNIYRI